LVIVHSWRRSASDFLSRTYHYCYRVELGGCASIIRLHRNAICSVEGRCIVAYDTQAGRSRLRHGEDGRRTAEAAPSWRGLVDWVVTFAAAAFNLIRLRTLLARPA